MSCRGEALPPSSFRFALLVLVLSLSPLLTAAASNLRPPAEVIPPGETSVTRSDGIPPAWMFFLPTISAGELTIQFQHDARLTARQSIASRLVLFLPGSFQN